LLFFYNGKVLAQGPPSEVSKLAADRTFLADPPAGQKARNLQAQLLDDPNVTDAVPEGGQVRLVRKDASR
jgi:ABC-2 type transport system ATP-binding protein